MTLVWCATLRREQVLRRAITQHLGGSTGMLVALACAQWADAAPDGLHDRVWLPLGGIRRAASRLTLTEVADAAVASTTVAPGATGSAPFDNWEEG